MTSGILVGEDMRNFEEKVILAKIGRGDVSTALVRPGGDHHLLRQDRPDSNVSRGASITGTVKVEDELVAEIELMFSHIDKNMAGREFPEHNFVFTEQFTELLKTYKFRNTVKI